MIATPAPPQQYIATLADIMVLNDKFIQYEFELVQPNELNFIAGQYASFLVNPNGTRRSYSICSSPSVTHGFELLIDMEPNGLGVQFFKNLKNGDEVSFLAPLGRFVINDVPVNDASTGNSSAESEITLIATGSGIAPFRSMILDLLQDKQDQRPVTLYWGMRFVEQLFWLDEFEDLQQSFSNFKFNPVISKPVPDWPLSRGRVTDVLGVLDCSIQAGYYVCGNPNMVEDIIALLGNKGIPVERIHQEKFA